MHAPRTKIIISLIAAFCLAVAAVSFLFRHTILPIKTGVTGKISPEDGELPRGWVETFDTPSHSGKNLLPEGWVIKNKPLTKPAVFSISADAAENTSVLSMKADRASASLITHAGAVDLEKTPILRWRWRVKKLPVGADGRSKTTDDQAIGIYVGTGSTMDNKSVSYRWDSETPKGSEGNTAYGLGTVKVKWYTLRNKEDAVGGLWLTEESNVAEDFLNAWGFVPGDIYLSVSCNSQYTGSEAEAELDWIGFDSVSGKLKQ